MAQAPIQPAPGRGAGGRGGAPPAPARGGGGGGAYPQRPPADPAIVARGKTLYSVHCSFCHGSDARGGEGGPNLIRAQIMLDDQNGELIAPVVQNGRPDRGMPKFDLNMAQISDIAAFVHSFRVGGYDISRERPPSIVVGDAKAGEAYFKSKCGSCHSVAADLKGIASRIEEPRQLQQHWLMPGGGRGGRGAQAGNVTPTTVTVTPSSGPKIEGRLIRIDDFIVVVALADDMHRTIRRDGDNPKVEIHDPLKPHRDLLPVYTDRDIHNVTAYLVTLK